MRGADFCPPCERVTAHALVSGPADPEDARRVFGRDADVRTVAAIAWTCLACGAVSRGTLERVLVELELRGLAPRPAPAGRRGASYPSCDGAAHG